ncbi:CDP-glycerol glycerophosphotransferase family protein [Caldibacillus lycopersici]|uniref:CDP-glycerol glycerophosphotransferase family protein n=1 Tax=Perspicuibacillus lycopersici TaxID=1325689 RepID=A0AAE3LMX8_9BACI|nr:CDP-glycerol glycerophosphotransferase family protein [Perspicuibacillus lycopersici]MCU9613257.1 CDP-glycerol glycerophosphotransferase family protein [Perspicuibacillus lycopersici]
MKLLRFIPTILVKYFLRTVYALCCLFNKVDTNKITFASYRSNELKDNLAFVHDRIAEAYPNYKRNYLFKKFDSSVAGKLKYILHMVESCYHLATSKYFLIDDYYFPLYVLKLRQGVDVIQLWHSAGALKKFGLSTVGKPFGPSEQYLKHVKVHGNYSKVYVSSQEVVPFYAEAFGMKEEHIYPLGIPRTDYFYNESKIHLQKDRFYQQYPELQDKKIILYAPTFRGRSHYQSKFQLPFDVTYMANQLGDEYVLFVHLHPYMTAGLDVTESNFLYHIQDSYTIQELLSLTDLLITDYSALFFDFCLLQRPMIFYPYDLDAYQQERDFYYQYEELVPGPVVYDTKSLVNCITSKQFKFDEISSFQKRFFEYQDGKATERIVEHFIDNEIVFVQNKENSIATN